MAWLVLDLAARLAVGGFFIYAAVPKILDPMQFSKDIYGYQIMPVELINFLAFLLPWLELIAGAAFVLAIWRLESGLTIAIMLGVFVAATAMAMSKGLDINCGCTGKDSSTSGWGVIGRNSVLLACLAVSAFAAVQTAKFRTRAAVNYEVAPAGDGD
jgi:hypothetical protein